MAKKKVKSFKQDLHEKLQDPKYALEYIKAALEERDMPEVFLLALRDIAEAKGMSKLAKQAKLNRENLYRMCGLR